MGRFPPSVYRALHRTDAQIVRWTRKARRELGLARPLRVLPYRGFGDARLACVKARVVEDRNVPHPKQGRGLLRSAWVSAKRYATVEIHNAPVTVRWGGKMWETVSDDEGFLNLWVRPPEGVEPGWHEVQLQVLEPDSDAPPVSGRAEVLVCDHHAEYGVISDVDDTVIVTGVTNLLKRAWALFLSDHRVRLPFEGVSAFYAALHSGVTAQGTNPIFYVSSSPWNLYEHLDDFFISHGIPAGPILLRDWGLHKEGFAPGGGHSHKRDKIRTLLETLPDLPFLLIGDSGQEDPEHYLQIVREYPGRIVAMYIRSVPSRPGRLEEVKRIGQQVEELGCKFASVRTTMAAALHAAHHGFVRAEEVEEVHRREQSDHKDATGPLDEWLHHREH